MFKKAKYLADMAKARTPQEVHSISKNYFGENRAYSLAPRYDYTQGPMYYFGQKVCVQMDRLGQPSKVHCCYRSPEEQSLLFTGIKNTRAKAWQSPHQYYEAVDIIHKTQGWPPDDDPYWRLLNDVAQNVAADLGLTIVGGFEDWGWDFAHFEAHDWRSWREVLKQRNGGKYRAPTSQERHERFRKLLPKVRYKYSDHAAAFDLMREEARAAEKKAASKKDQETLLQRLRDFF